MLTKKQIQKYKKALSEKLEAAGIQDATIQKVSKVRTFDNPGYVDPRDGGDSDPKKNPKRYAVPRYQAVNLHRQIMRKLLASSEASILQFLSSDLSQLNAKPPAPELTAEYLEQKYPHNDSEVADAKPTQG